LTHYQKTLALQPNHLGATHNVGITLTALKRFTEAKPYLEKAIEAEPDNMQALFHLGIILSAEGELEKAKLFYQKVLNMKPDDAATHHNLATLFLQEANREKALEHFETAYRILPENRTAEHMIKALKGEFDPQGAPSDYVRALFDQYAYSYDKHVKDKLHYQVPALMRQAISRFISIEQKPWKVLDLGCGTGLCAPYFRDIAGKFIGVDLSSNMLEIAKQRGGYDQLRLDDIQTVLKEYQHEFDLIISGDVFVYCGELRSIFENTYRALKTNGLFSFTIEKLEKKRSTACCAT